MTDKETLDSAIPATSEVLAEAKGLSEGMLTDIELSQASLSVIVLKALRLARLLNDFEAQQMFEWESSGYPRGESGASREVWAVATRAGRTFYSLPTKTAGSKLHMFGESIETLEHSVAIAATSLQAAQAGNPHERRSIRREMQVASQRLASRRTLIYSYATRKHYELKFAVLADDVFGRIRSFVDASIGLVVPDSVKKLTAVYDNLRSDNPEDWANASHSCRRLLQDLADAVFPAQIETRTLNVEGQKTEIKLGADQYINRLMAYIEDSSSSSRFNEIVGSQLSYMGERLDALFEAAQKGSHANVTKEEADRCVVYTYLIVGDILSLGAPPSTPIQFETEAEIELDYTDWADTTQN